MDPLGGSIGSNGLIESQWKTKIVQMDPLSGSNRSTKLAVFNPFAYNQLHNIRVLLVERQFKTNNPKWPYIPT